MDGGNGSSHGRDEATAGSGEHAQSPNRLRHGRAELYAQLRQLIDRAAESIRILAEENAGLAHANAELAHANAAVADRVALLERQMHALTSDLSNDELALRQSAERLEQTLQVIAHTRVAPGHAAPPMANPPQEADVPTETAPVWEEATAAMPEEAPSVEQEAFAPMAPDDMVSLPMEDTEPVVEDWQEAETPAPAPAMAADGDESDETMPSAEEPDATPVWQDEEMAPAAPTEDTAGTQLSGTYSLVAFPFIRFSDLSQFQSALQKLPGVHDVLVRRFAQGTLEMRVGYDGTDDFGTALRSLDADIDDVREEEPYRLQVHLRARQEA